MRHPMRHPENGRRAGIDSLGAPHPVGFVEFVAAKAKVCGGGWGVVIANGPLVPVIPAA